MAIRYLLLFAFVAGLFPGAEPWAAAQEAKPQILVNVNLVQLNVAVTDHKGNYITGLAPQDFSITEDQISEKIATFEEGDEPARNLTDVAQAGGTPKPGLEASSAQQLPLSRPQTAADPPQTFGSQISGANVFILFDTSNYMYRGFVFAQDAIADFIRSLQSAYRIAFYSYSRDLARDATLTSDRQEVLRGVRNTVAGDDAALYNCLLLTVKDAARYSGRKVIVVFSNGPDNASMVPPEDVAELAQSTGTIIYMVSTHAAQLEPISTAVFERMSKATGGKAYFARSWKDETQAFASIRDDLAHLYSISYYPRVNPNHGWRKITVKLNGRTLQKYRIRTRDGYRFQVAELSAGNASAPDTDPLAK